MAQNRNISTGVLEYYVSGLNCLDCVRKIEKCVSKLDWIEEAKVNFSTSQLRVKTNETVNNITSMDNEIGDELEKLGFGIKKEKNGISEANKTSVKDKKLFYLTIITALFVFFGVVTSYYYTYKFRSLNISVLFYSAAILSGGIYVSKKGVRSLLNLQLDINFLMCVAAIGAACIGEWLEGATVILLFLFAQLLETYTLDKARNAVHALMEISPKYAFVKAVSGVKRTDVDDVNIGDIILVRPGERIPLDGEVVDGYSTVNQSPITGESISVEKTAGDKVYAGTINEKGSFDVCITSLFRECTLSKIIHLIEEAQAQKAPFQSFVDTFAKYYTPTVVFTALLITLVPTFFFNGEFSHWLYRALVLLVISCPCALVISTPVALMSGITNAAKNGVLFKGGIYLENIGKIKAVAFDKTGTLTSGIPVVTDIVPVENENKEDILRIAAAIEARSEHNIATAILKKAENMALQKVDGNNFQSFTGKGAGMEIDGCKYYIGNTKLFKELDVSTVNIDEILCKFQISGNTTLILGTEEKVLGIITVADKIRNLSRQTIAELYNKGVKKIVMLTGDNKNTAKTVGQSVNIKDVFAELSPECKVDAVRSLIDKYKNVCMVGDGMNDAPALTAATVGVAMGRRGTDITLESADVTIVGDDLTKIPLAMELGKKTVNIIKQNICLSITTKVIFLSLIAPGFTTLWMAVGADMGASLIVILNGLRLLRKRW